MDFPPLLVSAMTPARKEGAILTLDLNQGAHAVLLPYPGALCATPDHLYVARNLGERTRLEKYDAAGLHWVKRLDNCFDTHSLALVGDRIAVCSTGTNQVIFLDRDGVEQSRWSPDERAEADSWHINSLTVHQGWLFATCFGRFRRFREWATQTDGAGLLLEIPSGRPVLSDFSAPHDPRRIDEGWLINESGRSRTLLVPDSGPVQMVGSATGFARGLAVLPHAYVIGFSTARNVERQEGCASILCVDRRDSRVLKVVDLPYAEIGHIIVAPSPEVIAAVRREQASPGPCLLPPHAPIPARDRAGSVTVTGPLRPSATRAGAIEIPVRLTNAGQAVWSSTGELPLHVGYRLIAADGRILGWEGPRSPLPVPIQPGRSLSFALALDLPTDNHLPAVAVRITLVQEMVAWWEQSEDWTPALLRLPSAGPARSVAHLPYARHASLPSAAFLP
jgi:hypothetical protein